MKSPLWMLIATLGLLFTQGSANAQVSYPSKPVRLIVPFSAGGPTDYFARAVGEVLAKALGQPVVVDNRPGADGAIAAHSVIGAQADGYTLLFATSSLVAVPLVSKAPAFDPSVDLASVAMVGRLEFGLVVHSDLQVKSVAELVTYARANPDKLNFATVNLGELMAASQFMKASGITMTRVPYKGAAQAMPDLMAGRIQVYFGPIAATLPQVNDGRLRLLATLLPQRSALAPDVPTMAELGYSAVSVPTWQAVFAPVKTPREVVERLSREIQAALTQPELKADLERRALHVDASSPQALASAVRQEKTAWLTLIREYGLDRE